MTVPKRVEISLMLGQVQQLKVKVVQQEKMHVGEYFMELTFKLQEVHIFREHLI